MKIKIVTIVCLTLLHSNLVYAKKTIFGLGAEVSHFGSVMYFPINTPNLLIEPSFSLSTSTTRPSGDSIASKRVDESIYIAVGVFKKSILSNKSNLYFGSRFAVSARRANSNSSTSTRTDTSTTFYIEPTLGVEYYPSADFSFGINIGVKLSLDKTKDSRSNPIDNVDSTRTDLLTTTAIIFRYHFN